MSIVKNLRDGTLTISDGTTPTALSTSISFIGDDGLSWTEKLNYIVQRNRGALAGRRAGDEEEVELTFSVQHVMYSAESGDSAATVVDALRKQGKASAWVSTGSTGEPYSVTLTFRVLAPEKGTPGVGKYEVFTFAKFVATQIGFKEGADGNSIEITGTSHVTKPTVTWAAPS